MNREISEFVRILFVELVKYCQDNNKKSFYFNKAFLKNKKIYAGKQRLSGTIYLTNDIAIIHINNIGYKLTNYAGANIIEKID